MTEKQHAEKVRIVVTKGTGEDLKEQVSECDGFIILSQAPNEEGVKELSISGNGMSALETASAILSLADQDADLKTILKAEFLKLAGEHILDIADEMNQSLVDRVVDENKAEDVQ
jgi:hypothetical protein